LHCQLNHHNATPDIYSHPLPLPWNHASHRHSPITSSLTPHPPSHHPLLPPLRAHPRVSRRAGPAHPSHRPGDRASAGGSRQRTTNHR
jgi:hypothetical protein